MKRPIAKAILILVALATSSTAALAGWHSVEPVVIDAAARSARGSIGTVRNGGDVFSDIGCTTYTAVSGQGSSPSAGTATSWGECWATDANRNYMVCSTQRADLIAIMRAAGPSSLISFTANASGYCQRVAVITASDYEPAR